MSAAVDTTTRSIPYAGVSNPMPRTTGQQRVKYAAIAVEMRKELGDCEPYHSHRERANSRLAQRAECVDLCPYSKESDGLSLTLLTIEQWRAHWRSLPDYDGPPMRAPSGFIVRFPAVEAADPSGSILERDELHRRLRALGAQKKRARRVDAADAVRAFGMAGALCFDPPSKGGRGWCPKLAGVDR